MIYKIPCTWEVYGVAKVEAKDLDEAVAMVEDDDFPLPNDNDYVDGSFCVEYEIVDMLNKEVKMKDEYDFSKGKIVTGVVKGDLLKVAEFIVDGYDYDTLVQSAINGTYYWLKRLSEKDLAEEIQLSGYEEG